MKIVLYTDSLMSKSGVSRVEMMLANRLGADIVTSGYGSNIAKWMSINRKTTVVDIGNLSGRFIPSISFFFEIPIRYLLHKRENYDVIIFSGISSIFAAKKGNNNIWFCNTPNRLLYDLRQWKLSQANFLVRWIFKLHIAMFYSIDQRAVKNNFKVVVSSTKNVQKRIKKYYGKDSYVIYPPVDTDKYTYKQFGDYYLGVSRLMPEKRMDLIAKAFTKMKSKKLILVGDGPEKNKIRDIIKGHTNIRLIDNVNENKLIDLYANCFAVIYMPINEDFGLVPLEGMASGKICIAANEGGCRETVIPNKTGYLISPTEKEIVKTITNITLPMVKNMKKYCVKWAKEFDIEKISRQWKSIINEMNTTYSQ